MQESQAIQASLINKIIQREFFWLCIVCVNIVQKKHCHYGVMISSPSKDIRNK